MLSILILSHHLQTKKQTRGCLQSESTVATMKCYAAFITVCHGGRHIKYVCLCAHVSAPVHVDELEVEKIAFL